MKKILHPFKDFIITFRRNNKFREKILFSLFGAFIGIILSYIYYPKFSYRLGLIDSPSIFERIVIYKIIDKDSLKLQRNQLYIFPFQKNTIYHKKGEIFIKYAKCLPGDKLEVKGLKYFCNGKYFATARTKDSKGRAIKHFVFSGIIPNNSVFMYAPHPRSYDSRYWGFLDKDKIIGVVKWNLLRW